MSGRQVQGPGRKVRARWLVGVGGLLTAALTVITLTPAGAATTVNAQLSLSGVATKDNVAGGSVVGIHPGDTVNFRAATLPTAGFESIGLGGLLGSVLGNITSYSVTANFSKVPGGKAGTVLTGTRAKSFRFTSKGTYPFTWSATALGLLGIPISLDGNQLKQAGVKLNASNQYVGSIVVADNPPKGGISIQLPGIKVAPSVPVLGQLPTISVPGIQLPTIQVPVPNLIPTKPGSGKSTVKTAAPPAKKSDYTPAVLTIPEMVVPKGSGDGVFVGNGGFNTGTGPGSNAGLGGVSNNQAAGGSTAGKTNANGGNAQSSPLKSKTVDLASQSSSASSALPVILAIVAILVLALVAGTYARLFLTRKA